MAVRTRTPSRGWSSVAPYSNYSYVVSNYAATLAAAIQAQKNTELENKVLNYRNGVLSYSELINYINSRIASEAPGTAKELTLRETLLNIEEYERDTQVKNTRARMQEQFAKDGISASEQRQIEEALLSYYKPGSTEYLAQQAVISTAMDNERVDRNNRRVASLQARLSEGDLNTGEQIQVLEEMKKYAEPGSQDMSEIEAKIGTMREQKRKEDRQASMNQRVSELMDQFTPGGITEEEALTINREQQKFVDKGTEDYITLKEQEASLLETIASGGGKGSAASKKQAQNIYNELAVQRQQLSNIDNLYRSGQITTGEYLRQKEAVLSTIVPSDIPQGIEDYGSPEELQNLYEMRQTVGEFPGLKEQVWSGQTIPVVVDSPIRGGKEVKLMSLAQITRDPSTIKASLYEDEQTPALDEEGNPVVGNIVEVIDESGNIKKVLFDENTGRFEEVSYDSKTNSALKTGKKYTAMDLVGQVAGKSALTGEAYSEPIVANKTAGPIMASVSKPSSSTSKSKSSGKSSSSSKSTVTATPSTKSSITSIVKTVAPTVASVVKQAVLPSYGSNKILGSGIKRGVIPGTVDIGVTEALGIGKLVKSAAKKITSLFKRK